MKNVRRVNLLAAATAISVLSIGVSGAAAVGTHNVHAVTASAHATKMKKLSFSAAYVGNVKILWGSQRVSGTMSGAGKGTTLGQGSVTATGATTSFSTSSASDPLSGTAVLKGPGGSLSVKSVSASASTTSSASPTKTAPAPVTLRGTVKVTKGTGKFAGATGTLTIHATFTVNTTTGNETQKFNATLKGSLSVKA
jgi:hypothetical protein